jgi:hypothetical protein
MCFCCLGRQQLTDVLDHLRVLTSPTGTAGCPY